MNIIILKSLNPLTIQNNPSSEMIQFAEMWLTSPQVELLRQMYVSLLKIPPEGFDITPFLNKNFDDIEEFKNPALKLVTTTIPSSILQKFNLSDAWMKNILTTLYFNAVVDVIENKGFLDNFPINFAVGKKSITSKLFDLGENEAIGLIIPYYTSKHQVHKWIDDHWIEIEKSLDSNFENKSPILVQLKNWSIGKEIDELKSKNFTYKEISLNLTDKYPDDIRMCDFDHIKKIHHRYLDSKQHFDSTFEKFLSLSGDT